MVGEIHLCNGPSDTIGKGMRRSVRKLLGMAAKVLVVNPGRIVTVWGEFASRPA
ncbi:hypothetical protein D3C77_804710 [compost metagenome]